jgi:hypothetical protein
MGCMGLNIMQLKTQRKEERRERGEMGRYMFATITNHQHDNARAAKNRNAPKNKLY